MKKLLNLFFIVFARSVLAQNCGNFTRADQEGPYFVQGAPRWNTLAPKYQLQDSDIAVILKGQVLDSDCIPVSGAVIDIWYAGFDQNSPDNAKYTFPPAKLLFRGNTVTDQAGAYKFLATFPEVYQARPIPHYHVKINTPGRNGIDFTTQIYFRNLVPQSFKNYVRTRGTQFGRISNAPKDENNLINGGRVVEFNVKLNYRQSVRRSEPIQPGSKPYFPN